MRKNDNKKESQNDSLCSLVRHYPTGNSRGSGFASLTNKRYILLAHVEGLHLYSALSLVSLSRTTAVRPLTNS